MKNDKQTTIVIFLYGVTGGIFVSIAMILLLTN